MAPRSDTKRARLAAYVRSLGERPVGIAEWDRAKQMLAPVSDSYLRTLLCRSGHPLEPLVEGVRHDSFENFDRTLAALPPAKEARRLVLESKQRLRWSKKQDAERQEMMLWTQTWLENPTVFHVWRTLRKRAIEAGLPRP